jgi:hypothetical protein
MKAPFSILTTEENLKETMEIIKSSIINLDDFETGKSNLKYRIGEAILEDLVIEIK